jgi:hypothetical protein
MAVPHRRVDDENRLGTFNNNLQSSTKPIVSVLRRRIHQYVGRELLKVARWNGLAALCLDTSTLSGNEEARWN